MTRQAKGDPTGPGSLVVEEVCKTYVLRRRPSWLPGGDDDEDDDELDDGGRRARRAAEDEEESEAARDDGLVEEKGVRRRDVLRGVSFTVRAGETVGVVGMRECGKSTLMDILARATLPTSGQVSGQGLVVSVTDLQRPLARLFTCRTNLHMAAAMLGLRRREVRALVDEAAELAGAKAYVDVRASRTPASVYGQLAGIFALLLRPEILLIDESGLMTQAKSGVSFASLLHDYIALGDRIVLIASNRLPVVTSYCTRAVWLDAGRVAADGPAEEVVAALGSRLLDTLDDGDATQRSRRAVEISAESTADLLAQVARLASGGGRVADPNYRVAGMAGQAPSDTDAVAAMAKKAAEEEAAAGETRHRAPANATLGAAGRILGVFVHTDRRRAVRSVAPGETVTVDVVLQLDRANVRVSAGCIVSLLGFDQAVGRFGQRKELIKTVSPAPIPTPHAGTFALRFEVPGAFTRQYVRLSALMTGITVRATVAGEGGKTYQSHLNAFWIVRGDLNVGVPGATHEIVGKPHKLLLRPELGWRLLEVDRRVLADTPET